MNTSSLFTKRSISGLVVVAIALGGMWYFDSTRASELGNANLTPLASTLLHSLPPVAQSVLLYSLLVGCALVAQRLLLIFTNGTVRGQLPLLLLPLLATVVPIATGQALIATMALGLALWATAIILSDRAEANPPSAAFRGSLLVGIAALLYPAALAWGVIPLVFERKTVSVSFAKIVLVPLGVALPAGVLAFYSYMMGIPLPELMPSYIPVLPAWDAALGFAQMHPLPLAYWGVMLAVWIATVVSPIKPHIARMSSFLYARSVNRIFVPLSLVGAWIYGDFGGGFISLSLPISTAIAYHFSLARPTWWRQLILWLLLLGGIAVVVMGE